MKTALRIAMFTFATLPAWSQCSLCKLAVEQDASLGTAFNKAIILMMVPALAVFAGVFIIAARSNYRNKPGEKSNKE